VAVTPWAPTAEREPGPHTRKPIVMQAITAGPRQGGAGDDQNDDTNVVLTGRRGVPLRFVYRVLQHRLHRFGLTLLPDRKDYPRV
jgi:hypothetical protein